MPNHSSQAELCGSIIGRNRDDLSFLGSQFLPIKAAAAAREAHP